MKKRSLLSLSLALLALAIGWPYIEDYVKTKTEGCPIFMDTTNTAAISEPTNVDGQEPKSSDSSSSSDSPSSSSSFLLSSSSPPQHAPLTPTQGDLNQQPPSPADAASTEKLPQLTEAQLRSYDGSEVDGKSSSIYLSIGGIIYDVTAGKSYYGPGGAYSIFAGKVCDRALALSKLEDKELNDSVDGLTKEHMGTLQHWKGFFAKKYPKIALLAKE